jgi:nucleotide-binding universal stress UspA family protein
LSNVIDLSVATRSEEAVVGLPIDQMRQRSAENQEQLLYEMTTAGIRATAHTEEAHNPAAAIVEYAKGVCADMIVTGANGRRGLEKAILGSCAEGIIRNAHCPVLTVGPKAKPASRGPLSFQTILFATDFGSAFAKKAALAFRFAQDNIAKIYLCHVMEKPDKNITDTLSMRLQFESELERLIPVSAYDWCEPEVIVESGEVAPHILSLAKQVKADLIILGTKRSATWFTHLVDGTVGKILLSAECPVMTVSA